MMRVSGTSSETIEIKDPAPSPFHETEGICGSLNRGLRARERCWLGRAFRRQQTLALRRSARRSATVIQIYDFSAEAGDEGYELEVYLSERDPRFTTTILYRPVGQKELELIEQSGWTAFPPRLPHQPIFYPVLSEGYAVQIARDWNTRDAASGHVGYVTRFAVDREYLARYPVQRAGSKEHLEYWIPAEDLEDFNRHIVGAIEVIAEFRPEQRPSA
jgi:hypothetical protein